MAYVRIHYTGGFYNGQVNFRSQRGLWFELNGDCSFEQKYYFQHLATPKQICHNNIADFAKKQKEVKRI
jgi:hypothetical protein